MSNFINQQAAQARIAEQVRAAEQQALVREARDAGRSEQVTTAPRTRRFRLAIGHFAHA